MKEIMPEIHLDIDTQWLAAAKAKDASAFKNLVIKHQAMVFSIARNLTNNSAVAEELAQDVFMRLYENIHRIESPQHLLFWLRRTSSNRGIDFLRRNKSSLNVPLNEMADVHASESGKDIMLAELLKKLVSALPAKYRAVITLRYQEDLLPNEISGVLDMPLNTVKSALQRSLSLLKRKLAKTREGL
ncbi:MAG: sigma-70 family RNA polymerase sigma factor [Methanoregulaceae archaeon]|nr:sigma-70 family RNA polymerase sigma factor [Methanoregulaceae archaeon]